MNIQVQTKDAITEVLMSQGVLGSPGPYIPTFYQLDMGLHSGSSDTSKVSMSLFKEKPNNIQFFFKHSPCLLLHIKISALQNALMQQHLAHLYFLTVLEQLQTKSHKPNFLVRLASKIDKVRMIYRTI